MLIEITWSWRLDLILWQLSSTFPPRPVSKQNAATKFLSIDYPLGVFFDVVDLMNWVHESSQMSGWTVRLRMFGFWVIRSQAEVTRVAICDARSCWPSPSTLRVATWLAVSYAGCQSNVYEARRCLQLVQAIWAPYEKQDVTSILSQPAHKSLPSDEWRDLSSFSRISVKISEVTSEHASSERSGNAGPKKWGKLNFFFIVNFLFSYCLTT